MIITLTRGQLLASLFPEAPATEEALIHFLRQRYAIGAFLPEVQVEGNLNHIHIEESEVEQTSVDYQRIVHLAEKKQSSKSATEIGGLKEETTGFSKNARIGKQGLSQHCCVEEVLHRRELVFSVVRAGYLSRFFQSAVSINDQGIR